jgi:hypothetical protein
VASPKLELLVLIAEKRQVLDGWARQLKTSQALALRSRVVLACAEARNSFTADKPDAVIGHRLPAGPPGPGSP